MNDYAVCLRHRSAYIAGKPGSHSKTRFLLERGLPAKDDYAVCLTHRSA
jgi:hypothetical protein